MSMKELIEKWRSLWQWLTAEADDEEYLDAAMVICDRCGGRNKADCGACPVKTKLPLHLPLPSCVEGLGAQLMYRRIIHVAIENLKYYSACCQCAHERPDGHPDCEACDYACNECSNYTCPCHDCDKGNKWVWRGPRQTGGAAE